MKAKNALFLTLALAALVLGYSFTQDRAVKTGEIPAPSAIEPATGEADISDTAATEPGDSQAPADTADEPVSETIAEESVETADSQASIDVEAALAERALGDPEAPVKIYEYASLSCGHCAQFHKTTFVALKEKYVDTGKVYFVYNDFPFNASALQAAMVARCLPQERYFQFLKFLFETQEQWAFSADYSDKLRQNAKLVGLTDDAFKACVENEDLKAGLIDRMQKVSQEHKIDSTPSFIINGTVVSGAQPLESFSKVIDPLLEEQE